MIKLAVAFSGEIRTFADVSDTWKRLHDEFKLCGITIDFYGHTWKHCIFPKQQHIQFKKIQITDQKEIDDWVFQKPWIRAFNDPGDLHSQINFFKMFKSTRRCIGQVVSAHRSFSLIDTDGYDFILKTRWDTFVNFENSNSAEIWSKELLNEKMSTLTDKSARVLYYTTPHNNLKNDMAIIFNTAGHRTFKEMDIMKLLEQLNGSQLRHQHSMSGHTLWWAVLSLKNYFNALEAPCNFIHIKHHGKSNIHPERIKK